MIRIVQVEPGSADRDAMLMLRTRVLRTPLGLSYSDRQLAEERDQIHVALRLDDRIVGTLLLIPPDKQGVAKLRQMAVAPECERRGFGRALVLHGERAVVQLGATTIALAARESAVGFYRRLGYAVHGEPFIEVTLPHRLMTKPGGAVDTGQT